MRSRRQGFTLIELLVVIAIIAILAAILFPVFAASKKRARMMSCLANERQLVAAMRNYSQDNSGKMPHPSSESNATHPNWCGCGIYDGYYWCHPEKGQLFRYVPSRGVFFCAEDKTVPWSRMNYIRSAPPGLKRSDFPLSYSMNKKVGEKNPDSLPIKRSSKFALIMHEDRYNINDGVFIPSTHPTRDIPADRHYDGTTIGYIDGHARWGSKDELVEECKEFWGAELPD